MTARLYCDFETRSRCDLKAHGVYNYAMDGSTEVLCMSYAFDDGPVQTWLPGQPFPERVANHTGPIYAHNAAFERLIFWYVLQIDFKLEQFVCTAAQARANCAPGSLEDAGRFAGAGMRKDHRGAQLIRLLSIPQSDGTFREDPALLQEMIQYCEQDVRAMRAISQSMRPLSAQELADYHVNERINDRGVLVDVPLCKAAMRYAEAELVEIQELVQDITAGEIKSVRSPRMREWVQARVGPQALKLMTVYKDGEKKISIDKTVRANLLDLAEVDYDEVPGDVADVIQCADDLWASSTAKFKRLADLADEEDSRVRGAFVFAGGSATGRASSYGAQVHNFPRKAHKAGAEVRHSMVRGHEIVPRFGNRITDVLKQMLRPALVPATGNVFVVADWSAIEGRVHPWLSNCPAGEAKLQVFRDGLDPYCVNAAATYHTDYATVLGEHDAGRSAMRQVGKVQELACFTAETKVLTRNGVKAIVDIGVSDELWDGESWVKHQGVVYRGKRATINVCGMEVTPDHLMLTGKTWRQAKALASNKQYLTQALATGSANLPCLEQSASDKARHGSVTRGYSALAAQRRIWSISTIFSGVRQHAATLARRSRLVIGARISTSTLMFARTTRIGAGSLTGCLRARTAAITRKIERTPTMAGAASSYTHRGEPIRWLFFNTFSLSMAGTSRNLNWTGSTLTEGMNRATCVSFLGRLTERISAKFKSCSGTSSNSKPVFDILNCGSRNRFTVISDAGPMIAHNCGFLGGAGSFATFGRIYNVHMTDEEVTRAVSGWRKANPWAMAHGQALEKAYLRAMRNKGYEFSAGRVTYLFDGLHLWYALPSGRVLCYPYARLEEDGVSYAKASWKPAADATEWPRGRLWMGLACENVTQATANDILRGALRQLEYEGFQTVLHVHDEIVLEVPLESSAGAANRLREIMETSPDWAAGLPLKTEIKTMVRYGKG